MLQGKYGMNKPHWEIKHDWFLEDFRFEIDQKNKFVLMLREHPEDKTGDVLRSIIKMIDKRISLLQKEYKKIYGTRFNLNRVRQKTN